MNNITLKLNDSVLLLIPRLFLMPNLSHPSLQFASFDSCFAVRSERLEARRGSCSFKNNPTKHSTIKVSVSVLLWIGICENSS
ncbi:MAG: hypothetical protein V1779_04860 [bacterium]